jgi:hypothetical protein
MNKGIHATIMTDPGMFFAFNNEINGINWLELDTVSPCSPMSSRRCSKEVSTGTAW